MQKIYNTHTHPRNMKRRRTADVDVDDDAVSYSRWGADPIRVCALRKAFEACQTEEQFAYTVGEVCTYRDARLALFALKRAVTQGRLAVPLNPPLWKRALDVAVDRLLGNVVQWLVQVGKVQPVVSDPYDWATELGVWIVCGDLERVKELCPESRWEEIHRYAAGTQIRVRPWYDPHAPSFSDSPAIWAIAAGHLHILQWLIRTVGMRPKYLGGHIGLDGRGFECPGNTALCVAAFMDHLDIVQWLCGPEVGFVQNAPFSTPFPIEYAGSITTRWFLTRPDCYHQRMDAKSIWPRITRMSVDDDDDSGSTWVSVLQCGGTMLLQHMDLGDAACRLLAAFIEAIPSEGLMYVKRQGASGPFVSRRLAFWHPETILLDGNERITDRGLVHLAKACKSAPLCPEIRVPHLHPQIYNQFVWTELPSSKPISHAGPFPTLFAIAMQAVIDRICARYPYKQGKEYLPVLERQLKDRIPKHVYDLIVSRTLPS